MAFLALSVLPFPVRGEPVTLKCTTSNGEKVSDVTIDLEAREMAFGPHMRYSVVVVNEDYISAYLHPATDFAGIVGEVWVMHRNTGDYVRAALLRTGSEDAMPEGAIYRGRCTKGLF